MTFDGTVCKEICFVTATMPFFGWSEIPLFFVFVFFWWHLTSAEFVSCEEEHLPFPQVLLYVYQTSLTTVPDAIVQKS